MLRAVVLLLALTTAARADDVLNRGAAVLDTPTVATLGVQLLVTGDDDGDAQVSVRFRPTGEPDWRAGLPLFRVHLALAECPR
jgi:hypothetical protein